MSKFERLRINPIDYMRERGWPVDHITYDPKLRGGMYSIVRGSTHDGTLLFSQELMDEALLPLAAKKTCHKSQGDLTGVQDMKYTVGPLRIAVVYGRVKLPCSETQRYRGQHERVRIPVICTPVMRSEARSLPGEWRKREARKIV